VTEADERRVGSSVEKGRKKPATRMVRGMKRGGRRRRGRWRSLPRRAGSRSREQELGAGAGCWNIQPSSLN
jgi:hypothetical protein